ncbi:TetR/AcrR family transcriptional regulator [Ferrimonas pelagia]|uniref:HTH tetR-type domain-containing protein n=1 Tax=Ferrimonas pelagia TaxID=1177826 RepID=A0ABP9ELQ8_9GAMM
MVDREQQYHELISAAEALLAKDCINSLSLNKIAKRSGYSNGTVYKHFRSLPDLMAALLGQRYRRSLSFDALVERDFDDVYSRLLVRSTYRPWLLASGKYVILAGADLPLDSVSPFARLDLERLMARHRHWLMDQLRALGIDAAYLCHGIDQIVDGCVLTIKKASSQEERLRSLEIFFDLITAFLSTLKQETSVSTEDVKAYLSRFARSYHQNYVALEL